MTSLIACPNCGSWNDRYTNRTCFLCKWDLRSRMFNDYIRNEADDLMDRHRRRREVNAHSVSLDEQPSPSPVHKQDDFHGGLAVVLGVHGWGYLVFTMRGVAVLTDEEVKLGRLR